MKLYHATTGDYQTGSDLVPLRRRCDNGEVTMDQVAEMVARWDGNWDAADYLFTDGTLISFTADIEEARAILVDWNGGEGVILCVESDDLEADDILTTDSQGYPAASGIVRAHLLTIVAGGD